VAGLRNLVTKLVWLCGGGLVEQAFGHREWTRILLGEERHRPARCVVSAQGGRVSDLTMRANIYDHIECVLRVGDWQRRANNGRSGAPSAKRETDYVGTAAKGLGIIKGNPEITRNGLGRYKRPNKTGNQVEHANCLAAIRKGAWFLNDAERMARSTTRNGDSLGRMAAINRRGSSPGKQLFFLNLSPSPRRIYSL